MLRALFIGEHPFDGLQIRGRHFRLAGERSLPARRLLGQDVRVERVVPQNLAASRLLEPLGGTAVRLHLRHSLSLNPLRLALIPYALTGAITIVMRLP